MIGSFVRPSMLFASCSELFELIAEIGLLQAAIQHEAEHAAMRATTLPTFIFDVLVITAAIAIFLWLSQRVEKFWVRAAAMATGVLIFEVFTAPMWINDNMGRFAYVYQDVSWILTIGWTAMILSVVILVDNRFSDWKAPRRFAAYLGILLVLVVIAEAIVVGVGIRKYSPEVLASVSGFKLLGVPIEILFYVPVFTSLVIAFYKYWSFVIDDIALVPVRKRKWLRAIMLGFIAVFFFELVVEPIARNEGFPAWSYLYHDISIISTAIWVLLIGIAAFLIDRFLVSYPIGMRFVAALFIIAALSLPVESWMITNGYRVYGESAVANFTGFTTPVTGVAVEVAFAIPLYLALVIGFIRYWEIVLDNQL